MTIINNCILRNTKKKKKINDNIYVLKWDLNGHALYLIHNELNNFD